MAGMEYPRFSLRTAAIDATLLCIVAFALRDMGWAVLGLLCGASSGHFTAMFMTRDWRIVFPAIGMVIGAITGQFVNPVD